MKIAVTYDKGEVFQHFGHTETFKLYEISNGKVAASQVCSTQGNGHSALAGFLKAQGVDTLICGGIGGGARMALDEAGIALYGGVSGNADAAVDSLLNGRLQYNPDIVCNHHAHAQGECGHHGCGNHSCKK